MTDDDIIKLVYKFCSKNQQYYYLYGSYEDFTQELMLKAFKIIKSYKCSESRFSTYLYKCLINSIYIKLTKVNRQKNKTNLISIDETFNDNCKIQIADDYDIESDIYDKIFTEQFLRQYGKYLSQTFIDKYINNMTINEIAKKQHKTKQAISIQLDKELKIIQNAIKIDNLDLIKQYYFKKQEKIRRLKYMQKHHCSVRTYFRHKARAKTKSKGDKTL